MHWSNLWCAALAFPATKETAMRIDPLAPPFSAEVQTQFDQLPSSWQPPFEHFKILARDPRLLRAYRLRSPAHLRARHPSPPPPEVFFLPGARPSPHALALCPRGHTFAGTPPPP